MRKYILQKHDIFASVLIGLATIMTAFVTFVGGMWGSTSTASYSKAIVHLSQANTSYLEYVQGGLDESELEKIFKDYEESFDESEKILSEADVANSNNDKFLLMTVMFAVSIFFGSMSLTVRSDNVKIYFFLLSFAIFLASGLWTITLPMPF